MKNIEKILKQLGELEEDGEFQVQITIRRSPKTAPEPKKVPEEVLESYMKMPLREFFVRQRFVDAGVSPAVTFAKLWNGPLKRVDEKNTEKRDVAELLTYSRRDLSMFRSGCGKLLFDRLEQVLAHHGLALSKSNKPTPKRRSGPGLASLLGHG